VSESICRNLFVDDKFEHPKMTSPSGCDQDMIPGTISHSWLKIDGKPIVFLLAYSFHSNRRGCDTPCHSNGKYGDIQGGEANRANRPYPCLPPWNTKASLDFRRHLSSHPQQRILLGDDKPCCQHLFFVRSLRVCENIILPTSTQPYLTHGCQSYMFNITEYIIFPQICV